MNIERKAAAPKTALVGGISSAARMLPDDNGVPFKVTRAQGPYLWDQAGRRYVDFALGFGGTILGHAHPDVVAASQAAVANGSLPAFAFEGEELAARALIRLTGALSQVSFVNSGSEAVHLACKIARAATGRSRIAKLAGSYDGWYEDVAFGMVGAPESLMTGERPDNGRTVLLRYNDIDDVERLFRERDDIAGIGESRKAHRQVDGGAKVVELLRLEIEDSATIFGDGGGEVERVAHAEVEREPAGGTPVVLKVELGDGGGKTLQRA
jgi:glutamate-1-semialdehyde aminotransferase